MRRDTIDLEAMLAAITPATRIIYLANPNNPTGTMVSADQLDQFLDRVPGHVLTVLDEAYCDFASDFAERDGVEYSHSLDYVRQRRPVVVLRTFSKAHSLAGLRVGYGFAPAEIMRCFARMRTVFSVSSMAEAAAIAALSDAQHAERTIRNNARGAEFLTQRLRTMGLRVVPTCANFLYFEVDEPASDVARRMEAEGVIVRPLTAWGAPNAIRVTIGTPLQNETFIAALERVLHPMPQDMAAD